MSNLATHLKALEREKYISISKSFVERKPNTRYKITERRPKCFQEAFGSVGGIDKAAEEIKNLTINF